LTTQNSRRIPHADAALHAANRILGKNPTRLCRQDRIARDIAKDNHQPEGQNPIVCKNKWTNAAQAWLRLSVERSGSNAHRAAISHAPPQQSAAIT
jgi:hypothetical protein